MAKLMLIDGNSLLYRAFFALPTDMATASGQVTNAVYGFTSMLINLVKDHHPDELVATFDRPEPTFRHKMLEGYKAGRAETPDILRQQMGLARQVVEALKIPIVDYPGFEADAVIATLATKAAERGDDVTIVTGDRDTYQLVSDPHVKVLYNKRGVSDYALYDEAGIELRTGVRPSKYPQYAALRGDPSDNLAGVSGVGEKTAAKLINSYGDLDGIYVHLDELTPKLRESLAAAQERVRANLAVTVLVRDLPLDVEAEAARFGGWDVDEVRRLFDFLEFRTLWDRLVEASPAGSGANTPSVEGPASVQVSVRRPESPQKLSTLLTDWGAAGARLALAGSWVGREGRSELLGVALAEVGVEIPVEAVWIDRATLGSSDVAEALGGALGPGGASVSAHDAKALMRSLAGEGVIFSNLDVDTAIAAYLVDPAGDQYLLEDLVERYAGLRLGSQEQGSGGQLDLMVQSPEPSVVAAQRCAGVAATVGPLRSALESRGMWALYEDVERPLVRVLAGMEIVGVRVDVAELRRLAGELSDEARRLEKEIQALAGVEFVVNSTPQLRQVLFERLGLTPQKRTKTGFSTDAQTLERLRGQHPIIESLLRYREVEKLRSTYGESLLHEVGPDGRIHATFNQTVARTGRLSSDQPNLHNIPVRSEEGRRLRRCFIPSEGRRFLIADYNQVELRVIAHLASEPALVEAFRVGTDIHNVTASRIYGVPGEKVTLAMRSKAKMVSYGLAYGMEAYGLAQRLGISVDEATEILDAYWKAFPAVRAYMDKVVAEARERGYTETLYGRRRPIPELQSSRYQVRAAGERQAMNSGIQGLAADIFKVALVRLYGRIESEGMRSVLVLQVHDEVIVEVPPDEESLAVSTVTDAMTKAAELDVPLTVNLAWGDNWASAKT